MTRIKAIATFVPPSDAERNLADLLAAQREISNLRSMRRELEQRNIALAQELEAKERELRMAQERIAELEIAAGERI
jgi:KaiC/GvpD/RAD55 family RecA-like ATPase